MLLKKGSAGMQFKLMVSLKAMTVRKLIKRFSIQKQFVPESKKK